MEIDAFLATWRAIDDAREGKPFDERSDPRRITLAFSAYLFTRAAIGSGMSVFELHQPFSRLVALENK